MDINDIGLTDIVPFKEDNCWYVKLIYKYEDKNGKHTVVVPKALVPFAQEYIPRINYLGPFCEKSVYDFPYINCSDSMLLHESVCDLAIERGINTPCLLLRHYHGVCFSRNDSR